VCRQEPLNTRDVIIMMTRQVLGSNRPGLDRGSNGSITAGGEGVEWFSGSAKEIKSATVTSLREKLCLVFGFFYFSGLITNKEVNKTFCE
jgi:hypothetical protein